MYGTYLFKMDSIVNKKDSSIKLFAWADMLDTTFNGISSYFGFDYSDTWEYAPTSIIMVNWGDTVRTTGNNFLLSKGFDIMGGCYYDADNLINSSLWMDYLLSRTTIQSVGVMYTSWGKKYGLLENFGIMLNEKRSSK